MRLSLLANANRLPVCKRAHRDGEPGKPDDAVDDDVGIVAQIGEIGDDFGERQGRSDLGSSAGVGHCDDLRPELVAWAMRMSIDEPTPRPTTS